MEIYLKNMNTISKLSFNLLEIFCYKHNSIS
jgi:hypothetical protein